MAKKNKGPKLKTLGEIYGSNNDSSSSSYATNQVEYLNNKLRANGIDPAQFDTRNPLEKALNLTPDQNFLFDIFEVLGRPQQAVFGAIDSAQKGEDVLQGAWEGLSGEKDTSGGQLLRNAGFEDSEGVGLDDILGLGLDILADPMDLIGVGLVGDVGKAIGTVGDVAKTADTISDVAKVADTASDVVKATKKATKGAKAASKGAKALDTASDVAKKVSTPTLKNFINSIDSVGVKIPFTSIGSDLITPSDAAFSLLGKGAKGAVKGADKAAETLFGLMDENALNAYKGLKTEFTDIFNSGSRLARDQIRKLSNSVRGRASVGAEIAERNIDLSLDKLQNSLIKSPSLTKDLSELGYDVNNVDDVSKLLNDLARNDEINSYAQVFKNGLDLEDLFRVTSDLELNKGGSLYLPDGQATRRITKRIDNIIRDNLKGKEFFETEPFRKKYPIISQFYNSKKPLWTREGDIIKFDKALTEDLLKFAKDTKDYTGLKNINSNFWGNTGFFGKSTLNTELSTGKGTIDDLINTLNKTTNGRKILGNYSQFTRNILGNIDEELAKGDFNIRGKWQENADYSQNVVNQDILDLTKNKDSFKETLGQRTISNRVPSAYFDSFVKKVVGLNDPDFMPSLPADIKNLVSETILEHGFYDSGENFVSNLKKLADKNGPYAKKLSESLIFDTYIQKIVGDDLVKETNEMIELSDGLNFNWNKANDMVRNSNSSIIFLPSGAKGNINKALLNSMQELDKGQLQEAIHNINRRTYSHFGNTKLGKNIKKMFEDSKGKGSYWIDKQVNHYIKLASEPEKTTSDVIKLINGINNGFKKGKLLSPDFNIRNVIGNAFNMLMAGVPVKDVISGMIDGVKKAQLADEGLSLLAKGQKITDEMKNAINDINQLRYYGFSEAGTMVQGVEDLVNQSENTIDALGKVGNAINSGITKVNNLNINLNNKVDTASRLALFDYARANPEWMTKNGFKDFGDAVAFSLFDPGDLSLVEKNKIKKVIPFYTFAKKNLMYQISNLPKNGSKYYEFKKAIDGLWNATGLEEEEISPYRSNSYQIPIPFANSDGTYNVIDANLPINDLIDFIENPANKIASSFTPVIRAPFELANNLNTYTGMPIEEFPGQQSDLLSRTPLANTGLNREGAEWLIGNLGLDVPTRTTANIWDLLTNDTFQGGDVLKNTLDNLRGMTNIIKPNDPVKARVSRDYQTLEKLENYIDLLEQGGIELQTITELERTQNPTNSSYLTLESSLNELLNK